MKATLTFDLREDQHTFDCMMNAMNMHQTILEMREHLRSLEKYKNLPEEQELLVADLRQWLQDEIQAQGLTHLF